MDIRLLVLDIDGTIAGQSNDVTENVIEAIRAVRAKGIEVALATGRMFGSAQRFHSKIGSKLPIIAYNGAWIEDPLTRIRHHHHPISSAIALQLLDEFEQPELKYRLDIHCYIDDQLYVREVTAETEYYEQRTGIPSIAVGDLREVLTATPTTKLLTISHDLPLIQTLLTQLPTRYTPTEIHFTQSTPKYLEITHPQANKGIATRYLAEAVLGLKADQVMAIGDNFNDREMLQYAGMSIAMGNAPITVQKWAKWVAPDVEADGVAIAIEKFLLS